MGVEGFAAARQKSERVSAALREIADLIGGPEKARPEGETERGLGMLSEAANLRLRARDTEQGIFKLLVLGRFKNGKSTLLNAMLGDAVLPVAAVPATAVITVLVHGAGREVMVYESGREWPLVLSPEEFQANFRLTQEDQESLRRNQSVDRFHAIEYAQIECLHPLCANGVRLVDSPGLGEAASRARVAAGFLQQAHAVIFVLDATAILGQDEQEFIRSRLAQPALESHNIFFAVNRVNLIDAGERDQVEAWLRRGLHDYFLDTEAGFDADLYARRVFFVDARGALAARMQPPLDLAALEATGVPALERELERFLTSEGRLEAEFGAPCQAARQAVLDAGRGIRRTKAALDTPLAELERRRQETERRLAALDADRARIEQTVLRFGGVVRHKVSADLRAYLREMHESWPLDAGIGTGAGAGADRLVSLDEVSGEDVLRAMHPATRDEARRRITEVLQAQVDGYLRLKLERWAERVPEVVQPDIDLMLQEVGRQVDDFAVELGRLQDLFAGQEASDANRVLADLERGHGAATAVGLMSLMLDDLGKKLGAGAGGDDWGGMVRWLIGHALVGWAIVAVFGFVALPLFLVAEVFLIQRPLDKFREIVLTRVGEQLDADLQRLLPAKEEEIGARIAAQFQQTAASVNAVLQAQVDELRAEQERIIRQRQDQRFSVEQEKQRLDATGARLLEVLEAVSVEAYARALTLAELAEVAPVTPRSAG